MMKRFIVVLCAALALSFSAKAQDFTPGWDLGVMGGMNYVTSNNWQISKFQHVTPNASLNLAYNVSPWLAFRASVSGAFGTYPIQGKTIGKFNYAQAGLDAVIDICNLFNYNEERFFSPYIFVGGAGNYRLAVKDVKAYFGPGVRAGLGFDFRVSDKMKVAIELQDNALNNNFNSLDDNTYFGGDILMWKRPFKWDDNFAALIGVKFAL